MTDADLDAIRAAVADATPGPWRYQWQLNSYVLRWPHSGQSTIGRIFSEDDARWICAARLLVPQLLAEVDRLRAELFVVRSDPTRWQQEGER